MTRPATAVTFTCDDEPARFSARLPLALRSRSPGEERAPLPLSPEQLLGWWSEHVENLKDASWWRRVLDLRAAPHHLSTAHGPAHFRYHLGGEGGADAPLLLAWIALSGMEEERLRGVTLPGVHLERHVHTLRLVPDDPLELVTLERIELERCESYPDEADLLHYLSITPSGERRVIPASRARGALTSAR